MALCYDEHTKNFCNAAKQREHELLDKRKNAHEHGLVSFLSQILQILFELLLTMAMIPGHGLTHHDRSPSSISISPIHCILG